MDWDRLGCTLGYTRARNGTHWEQDQSTMGPSKTRTGATGIMV